VPPLARRLAHEAQRLDVASWLRQRAARGAPKFEKLPWLENCKTQQREVRVELDIRS